MCVMYTCKRFNMWPFWYEAITITWYAGLLLAQLTNPGAKGGLAWIKSFNVFLGVCALCVHIVAIFLDPYYWSLLIYIR